VAKKRGYRTVSLQLTRKKRLKLYTSERVANAAHEVLDKLDTLYHGTRLAQVLEEVLKRGRREGRAEVFGKLDAAKKSLPYRLPGRPRKQ
jgi:hypothetical protein